MKLIIDIPDNIYKFIKDRGHLPYAVSLANVIEDGIPYEERPKGEWTIRNQDNEGIHKIECPFCKYVKGDNFGGLITLTFDRLPPFCENCGARMESDV